MNFSPFSPLNSRFAPGARVASFSVTTAARVLAVVLLAGFAATGATAQQTGSNVVIISGPNYSGYYTPAPPRPPPPETQNFGPSLGPEWIRPYSNDLLPGIWFHTDSNGRPVPGPFFLPTLLPVLGAAPSANPLRLAANYPREFAGEPFFMAYGNLAANHELSDKRADHLVSYRTARFTLLTELQGELDHSHDLPAADGARALAQLAAVQTPRLLELEAEAEQIRHELTHVELFNIAADDIGRMAPTDVNFTYGNHMFNAGPPHLGYEESVKKDPKLNAALASMRQLLSAAHSQDGFSLDQRRLLEEMAQEIVLTIEPPAGPAAVFFWPAGARIRVPAGLPTKAAAQFEEFQRRKAALKDELRAALDREKARIFKFDDTEAHERLAAFQAARFAELDNLADEIRPALATLADADNTTVAALPADLARQVTSLVERKAALQRDLYGRLVEFRSRLPAERIELSRQNNGLAIAIVTNNSSDNNSNRAAVLAKINEFNEDISARFTALATLRDRVRDDLARYQASVPGTTPGLTVDRLAADFLAAYTARENRNRQRDYAAAVLVSGLSPAQRRLLLAATAMASLPKTPFLEP